MNESNIRRIPLTKGAHATVDAEDYERLAAHKWYLQTKGYAARTVRITPGRSGKKKVIYLHHEVLGFPGSVSIDHIDRNTLNNSKSNLRECSATQNQCNQPAIQKTSKFKGVHYFTAGQRTKRWKAVIQFERKKTSLGYFMTEEEAARAYDEAARRIHGDFAVTNF